MASTTASALLSNFLNPLFFNLLNGWIGIPSFSATSRFIRASPLTSFFSPNRTTSTCIPLFHRCLATTNPSPPLFPLPHTTHTLWSISNETISLIISTTPIPAFSISVVPGIPRPFIVFLSSILISSTESTFIKTLLFLLFNFFLYCLSRLRYASKNLYEIKGYKSD